MFVLPLADMLFIFLSHDLGARKIDHKVEHENFSAFEKITEVLKKLEH
jgi:hypothetical protein